MIGEEIRSTMRSGPWAYKKLAETVYKKHPPRCGEPKMCDDAVLFVVIQKK